jgi:hypothetical protein
VEVGLIGICTNIDIRLGKLVRGDMSRRVWDVEGDKMDKTGGQVRRKAELDMTGGQRSGVWRRNGWTRLGIKSKGE